LKGPKDAGVAGGEKKKIHPKNTRKGEGSAASRKKTCIEACMKAGKR